MKQLTTLEQINMLLKHANRNGKQIEEFRIREKTVKRADQSLYMQRVVFAEYGEKAGWAYQTIFCLGEDLDCIFECRDN